MAHPTIVAVGGFESDVGKTTVMCDLLGVLPGWEAIKTTRGHYRSCGRDPHACCVSHLLSNQPIIRSGLKETYTPGKDTGRYWDAGASNVHWLIATEAQLESGIKAALRRVKAPGVLIEGNSFTRFVEVDFVLMVTRSGRSKMKSSARLLLGRASGLYVSEFDDLSDASHKDSGSTRKEPTRGEPFGALPIYFHDDLPRIARLLTQEKLAGPR